MLNVRRVDLRLNVNAFGFIFYVCMVQPIFKVMIIDPALIVIALDAITKFSLSNYFVA